MNQEVSVFEKILFLQGKDSINRMQFIVRFLIFVGVCVCWHFGFEFLSATFGSTHKGLIKVMEILSFFFLFFVLSSLCEKRFRDIASSRDVEKWRGRLDFILILSLIVRITSNSYSSADQSMQLGFRSFLMAILVVIIIGGMLLPTGFFKESQE